MLFQDRSRVPGPLRRSAEPLGVPGPIRVPGPLHRSGTPMVPAHPRASQDQAYIGSMQLDFAIRPGSGSTKLLQSKSAIEILKQLYTMCLYMYMLEKRLARWLRVLVGFLTGCECVRVHRRVRFQRVRIQGITPDSQRNPPPRLRTRTCTI